ncbi:MAG: transcriptional regulator GcvA [Luteibacter sp.]|uniref:transcriptional regulator GcvA n=1 Tax=Luteibacter sp. TaxID=1886636 RepID=UPI0028070399|nr:transcriptional regulator GcvA [Luteibacter sp.]MDQ7995246.1 transcriptional regulator GcvA [Luteibacter sp.]
MTVAGACIQEWGLRAQASNGIFFADPIEKLPGMKSPVFLNALRAFECAARHQSFAGAAEELNVTPAAIGQLVRSLEGWLGVALFHRMAKGKHRLVPTDAAERALPDIRAGFDRLSTGLSRLREGSESGILTVTVSPAFASKWLMPRIEHFREACPAIDVRLDTNLRLVDFALQGIDIGVRYGRGDWPGLVSEKLMAEEVFPVASPRWVANHPAITTPQQLATVPLIHDLSVETHVGFVGWSAWFAHAGLNASDISRGMQINNSAAVLQAAMDGQGVALARSVMAQDDVAHGRLVRLLPAIHMMTELAYYVVYRADCAALPKIATFRDWLRGEAQAAAMRPSLVR